MSPTCPRDGATLARVEVLEDWRLARRCAVFACGHREWEPAPVAEARLREDGQRRCRGCAQWFTPDGRVAQLCADCKRCPCNRTPAGHRVAECQKGAA